MTELKNEKTLKQKRIIAAVSFAVFLLFCSAVAYFVGVPMLKFVEEPERFRGWVESKGIWGECAFVGMVILQVIVALIPGEPLEIGAGYAFGAVKGTLLTVVGITIGSLIVFLLVRRFGVLLLEVFFNPEKINSLKILKDSKKRNIIIFVLFFCPGTPKDLLTYFVGLTDMKLWQFLLLASFARLPSVVTSTIGGDKLGISDYKMAIIIFAVAAVVAIAGVLIYKKITTHKKENSRNA